MRPAIEKLLSEIADADDAGKCDIEPRRPMRRRWELSSAGIDPFLQTLGGDPDGSLTSTGLLVPPAPFSLPSPGNAGVGRYTFQLVTATLGVGRRVRLRGMGQLLTIGAVQNFAGLPMWHHAAVEAVRAGLITAPRVVAMPVTTPTWRFADGNVSWHLRRVSPKVVAHARATNSDNFIFRWGGASGSGALLYESFHAPAAHVDPQGRPDFYTSLDQYVPPYGGRIYGAPLDGQLTTIRDVRFPWAEDEVWSSLDIPVEGPCTVALFASVRQTNPATRPALAVAGIPNGLPPEEQFLLSFPTAAYWRIGGRLIFEDES